MTNDLLTEEIVAAFVLSRADAYVNGSGCWIALADTAHEIMNGEHLRAFFENELDDDLIDRVRAFRRDHQRKPVDPQMGVDP